MMRVRTVALVIALTLAASAAVAERQSVLPTIEPHFEYLEFFLPTEWHAPVTPLPRDRLLLERRTKLFAAWVVLRGYPCDAVSAFHHWTYANRYTVYCDGDSRAYDLDHVWTPAGERTNQFYVSPRKCKPMTPPERLRMRRQQEN